MIYPVPKPAKRGPKERAPKLTNREPMKRTRMKQVNRKRGGSSFPKQRDPEYRRWIRTENECLLVGECTEVQITLWDAPCTVLDSRIGWTHHCWGPIDPAHVGDKQSQGAPDFGVLVPLCRAAHHFYDDRRIDWPRVTGYSEAKMASAASGYALKYVESGGAVPSPDPKEPK